MSRLGPPGRIITSAVTIEVCSALSIVNVGVKRSLLCTGLLLCVVWIESGWTNKIVSALTSLSCSKCLS